MDKYEAIIEEATFEQRAKERTLAAQGQMHAAVNNHSILAFDRIPRQTGDLLTPTR